MLFINTELIFFSADLLLVTAGIKKFPPWDEKIPSLGLKRSQGGNSIWDKVPFLTAYSQQPARDLNDYCEKFRNAFLDS